MALYPEMLRLLSHLGLDVPPETVSRYIEVLQDISKSSEADLENITKGIFDEDFSGMMVERGIPVYSYCEHHILPWFGSADIAYISHGPILGLSKFTRLLTYYCKGLTIQERVTKSVADFLVTYISPDVIVVISAIHTCKVARGVKNPFATSTTIDARGLFRKGSGPRLEFFLANSSIGLK